MRQFIFEVPVYCGRLKEWRVLNLSTGTVYSMAFHTHEEAFNSIEDGKERAGRIVKAISVPKIDAVMQYSENKK